MELTIDEKKTLKSILKTEIIEVKDLIKMPDELRTHLAKVVVIPVISIGGTQLIKLINYKISSSEGQSLLTKATETVINAVRTVLQTYVDTLRRKESLTKQAKN